MIPFAPPRIDEKIIFEVINTLKSGWITTGPKTKLFEKKLAAFCDIENILAVSSWTAGAEMVLNWFGIGKDDEVILPAYTYCATANIIIHCGAKPIMVDVGDDFCINTDKIKEAITTKTKAIITVDIAGFPVDYDEINNIIIQNKKKFKAKNSIQETLGRILLLSDAAHSFGGNYNNKPIGTKADFTVFSFHAVKNLTTAEGGGICINMPFPFDNLSIYKELNILSLHGQNKDALAKSQKGAWEYDVSVAGFKCNMTDILASIGLVELERYKTETLSKRRAIFEKYNNLLKEYNWAILPTAIKENRESSYHLYLLRISNISLEQRNKIIDLIFEKGVSVNVHYKPLPLLTFYKKLGYSIEEYPLSKKLWESEISLPVYYDLKFEQVEEVVNALVQSYNEVQNI